MLSLFIFFKIYCFAFLKALSKLNEKIINKNIKTLKINQFLKKMEFVNIKKKN